MSNYPTAIESNAIWTIYSMIGSHSKLDHSRHKGMLYTDPKYYE